VRVEEHPIGSVLSNRVQLLPTASAKEKGGRQLRDREVSSALGKVARMDLVVKKKGKEKRGTEIPQDSLLRET